MTTLIDDRRASAALASPAQYFYFNMALACAAVAFLGFAPTYFLPLARGSYSATPVIHAHGILFFAWTLFFVFQSWLAASGRVMRHRSIGMIGISLATAMTIFGFLVGVGAMKRSAAVGQTDEGIAFVIVPWSGILFFAVVLAIGYRNGAPAGIAQAADAAGQHLDPGCCGGALVPDLPGASWTARPAAGRGDDPACPSSPICCWWSPWCTTGAPAAGRTRSM